MKKISLSEWAAIAEIVATLGLIASIAFVAYSVNQNTRALQASNDNILYEMQDKLYASYVTRETLVSTGGKLLNGEPIAPVEKAQYTWHLCRYFNLWEMAYDRYHEGLLSRAKWDLGVGRLR